MKYTFFLNLEPYLAQFLIHENGGETPIKLKRGTAEADILALHLRRRPKDPDYIPQLEPEPGQVEIQIPCYKHIDIREHNYVSDRAAMCIHACIRHRFCVELWRDLYTIGNITKRTDMLIDEWMAKHGIEQNEKNWNTIAKILQRKRAIYCAGKRLTDRKTSKHRKK